MLIKWTKAGSMLGSVGKIKFYSAKRRSFRIKLASVTPALEHFNSVFNNLMNIFMENVQIT